MQWGYSKTTFTLSTATMVFLAVAADASVIYRELNAPVPATFSGAQFDVETGTVDDAVNWDFRVYRSGSNWRLRVNNSAEGSGVAGNTSGSINLTRIYNLGFLVDDTTSFVNNTTGNTLLTAPTGTTLLGFRVYNPDDGETRYGWMRTQLQNGGTPGGTIIEYAYETSPGVGIRTGDVPEPTSLGLLGLGGLALIGRRRH